MSHGPTALRTHLGASTPRFEAIAGSVAGLILLLTLIVLWRGDQTVYEPSLASPPEHSSEVSTRATVGLSYGSDLDGRTLSGRIRLEPEASGQLTVSGSNAWWVPRPALRPVTEYSIVVEPGVRSLGGERQQRVSRFSFRTRAPRLLLARPSPTGVDLVALTLDGAERAIARIEATARDLAPSPDGDRLAYVAGDPAGPGRDQLWILDLLGGERVRVGEPVALSLGHPAWSPDGRRLVYERRDPRGEVVERFDLSAPPRGLGLADVEGQPLGTLYGEGGGAGYLPLFAPFTERLAFFEPNYRAIVVFSGGALFASIPWEGGTIAAWSPDETALLVTESEPTPTDPARTVARILSLDGSPARALTPPGVGDRAPAWSPDGELIALVRSGTEGTGIWIAAPNDAASPVLVDGNSVYSRPSWSADGRWLAFSRVRRQDSRRLPEVWLAPRGGPPRLLAVEGEVVGWLP